MSETLVNKLDKLVEDSNIYNKGQAKTQKQLNEENEELRQCVESELDDVTVKSAEINVTDAAKYNRNKLELFGNTSQDSYQGYNLVDVSPYQEETKNGVTLSKDSDGNIILNGTSTSSFGWNVSLPETRVLPAGTYTKSITKDSNIGTYLTVNIGYNGSSISGTSIQPSRGINPMTFEQDTNYDQVRMYISNNTTFNNYKLSYMILSGEYTAQTIPDYEPYVGGVPSPNPDYPQDIHVVSGSNSVGVQGENLFDRNKVTIYGGYFSATGVIKGKGSSGSSPDKWFYVPCKPNTTYIIIKPVTPVLSNNRFRIGTTASIPNDNSILNDFGMEPNGSTVTQHIITTSNNAKYLCVYYGTNPDAWGDKILEVLDGLIISYFSSYPINLGDRELCKIEQNATSSIQDYYFKEDSNWYEYKAIIKKTINNVTNWAIQSNSKQREKTRVFEHNFVDKAVGRVISNNFKNKGVVLTTTDDEEYIGDGAGYNQRVYISIKKDRLVGYDDSMTDSQANQLFQTWLSNSNTLLYYIKATPTVTQITDETLISQLDATYEHLKLVKGTNNISITASDLAPYMQLTYKRSNAIKFQKEIDELKAMVIENS